MKVGDRVQIIESRAVGKVTETEATPGNGVYRFKVLGHWYYKHELKQK